MESMRGTSALPARRSAGGADLDGDVEVQRARGSLQRREGRADTAGFEAGDRGLAGSHPLGKFALTQLGRNARVADLFADPDREHRCRVRLVELGALGRAGAGKATPVQLLDRGASRQSSSAV